MNAPLNHANIPGQIAPLLRRTQLLPGESLSSLLERLTRINYYTTGSVLARICCTSQKDPKRRGTLGWPAQTQTFLQLAQLTQIPPEDLYAASDHRFASVLSPHQQPRLRMLWTDGTPRIRTTSQMAYDHLRFPAVAQYCPLCLRTSPYHRLIWTPIATTICLEHRCLLVDRCPQCQNSIAISDILSQHCSVCQADLSAAEAVPVADDALGVLSQQLIQSWLWGAAPPELPARCALPPQPPAALYRLLHFLCQRLRLCQDAWPTLPAPLDGLTKIISAPDHHLQEWTTAQVYHLYRAACTGVVDWPHGICQFLDAYISSNLSRQTPTHRNQHLEVVWHDWLQPAWNVPGLHFIQRTLVDYLLDRDIPLSLSLIRLFHEETWFTEMTGLWTEDHTAPVLGLSLQDLRRLCVDGPFGACLWPHNQPSLRLFEQNKTTLTLQCQWQWEWSVSEAGKWLGLGKQDILYLIERDLVTAHQEQDAEGSTQWLLDRDSVEAFFRRVVSRVSIFAGDTDELVCLGDTITIIRSLGIDRVALLQGVADGVLCAYKRKPVIPSLGHVCFLDADITSLPDLIHARRGWISGRRFASDHGISPRVVVEWVQAGLIQPHVAAGTHRYFDRESLEQLAAKLLT
jgi:hypothetical protein